MQTTRRQILKAAIAVPVIIPSAVWAVKAPPSEQIRVGVVGTGRLIQGLLPSFLHASKVVAVCDVDTTRREDAQQKVKKHYAETGNNDCDAYENYEDLLARDDIDAVVIATPDHWHAIITIAALRAGKDVYCEKPLTHDIAESIAIMKEVEKTGRVLQTGSWQRSKKEFRVACELARNGIAGKVESVTTSFGDPARPCDLPEETMEPGLDWNQWVGPAPTHPYNSELSPRGVHKHFPQWRRYREFGGGGLADMGAHHLDIVQWALGMDASGPVKALPPEDPNAKRGTRLVYANGVEVTHTPGFDVDMKCSNGRIQVGRGKFHLELEGKTFAKFTQKEDGGSLDRAVILTEEEFLKDAKVRLYKPDGSHVEDFLKSMRTRKKPLTDEIIGSRSAICCHLMNLAYEHHQPIMWDPIKLAFSDTSCNPKWLTGSQRDYKKS